MQQTILIVLYELNNVSKNQEKPKTKKLSETISQKIGYGESMSKLNRLFDPFVDLVETKQLGRKRIRPEEKQGPTSEAELVVRKGRVENKDTLPTVAEDEP